MGKKKRSRAELQSGSTNPEEYDLQEPPKKMVREKTEEEYEKMEKEMAKKYQRGERVNYKKIKDRKIRGNLEKTEKLAEEAVKDAVKAQILLTEEAGYLEPEGMEETHLFTQKDLLPHVDIQTANKMFDLVLDELGPYKIDYSQSGRHLMLCGRRGHVAMLDWNTKELITELFLNETCKDVKFLHNFTFFATAQKKFTYIYDKSGAEIHRLEQMNAPTALDFLPHHFLLASVNEGGCLKYQDTSTGRFVTSIYTKLGSTNVLRQNPWNAVMNIGHKNGCVTMWAPNQNTSLVKMQCHAGPITSLAVDISGRYMVTTGRDSKLKIWDIRKYKELYSYFTPTPASTVDISQKGVVSAGCGGVVQMWKNCWNEKQTKPYMQHFVKSQTIESTRFCPYEDFLGIGHSAGFASVVVPGCGEPNFDSFSANPFQTLKQRREGEVHALLDKIQPEMIQLDPTAIGTLNTQATDSNEDTNKYLEKSKKQKNKMRGKNTASKRVNIKQQNVWDKNRELMKEKVEQKESKQKAKPNPNVPKALSRFK